MTPQEFMLIRKELGLSRHLLAQQMGVADSTIIRWEGGTIPITSIAGKLMDLWRIRRQEGYSDQHPMRSYEDNVALWAGDFGLEYEQRNAPKDSDQFNLRVEMMKRLTEMVGPFPSIVGGKIERVLEIGCGAGHNLLALASQGPGWMKPKGSWVGIDVNKSLVGKSLWDKPSITTTFATATDLPFQDSRFQLVFTVGTLIHISPLEALDKAYSEILRVSDGYIALAEYFSPKPQYINYRGIEGALWKRDFGGELKKTAKELGMKLEVLDYGHMFKSMGDIDDLAFWVFKKKGMERANA